LKAEDPKLVTKVTTAEKMPTTENQPLVFGGIALCMVCEFFHEVWVAD